MSKRALVYIVAGVACALGAVLLAKKYLLSRPPSTGNTMPLTKVLIAHKKVSHGTALELNTDTPKQGNVRFVSWPKKWVPEGAFQSPDELKDKELVIVDDMVPGEPVLASRVVTKDQWIPRDMMVEGLTVDRDYLVGINAGDRVDILKVTGNRSVEEFLTCVPVLSVGKPPGAKKEGGRSEGSKIYLLLPGSMRELMLEAKLRYKLMVQRTLSPCTGNEARLVTEESDERARQAQRAYEVAEALYDNEQYSAALLSYQKLAAEYAGLPEAQKAQQRMAECQKEMAQQQINEIRVALQREEYQRVVELAEDIKKAYPGMDAVVEESQQLAEQASKALELRRREKQYREFCSGLDEMVKGGNLPGARTMLKDLDNWKGYVPGGALKTPEEVKQQTEAVIKGKEMEFTKDMRVYQYYVAAADKQKAVDKIKEIKEGFPQHPDVLKAETELRQKGWLPQ